jgi:hypothetical protein
MSVTQIQRATAIVKSEWFEDDIERKAQGTAFLISDKYLLTAYHTVKKAQKITVTFINTQPGESDTHEVRLIKFDENVDVAILELTSAMSASILPLPLSSRPLALGDKWQTYGFTSTRLLTGQTIHGTTLQYNNLANQTWTLGTYDIFPTTVLKGLSGAACIHEGFVYGILRRREEQHICLVSIENFDYLLKELGIEVYADPLDAVDKAIKDAVNLQQPPPLENSDYTEREEFGELFEELRSHRFVLLSGDSFCGKSTLAKRVMVEFWSIGYRYLVTNDPYEARRFLNEDTSSICLLDDPYGYEGQSNWKIVKEVCQDIKANNKLLVTSKRDALIQITGNSNLANYKINGREWHDLTVSSRALLLSIWDKFQRKANLDNDIVLKVREHLEQDRDELLQPGHLVQLANEGNENLVGKSFNELRHVAMADAHELGISFRNKGDEYWIIAVCLALTCNTIKLVNQEDLNYILNQTVTPDASFGKIETFRVQSFFVNNHHDPDHIPEYNSLPPLTEAPLITALNFFEDRRYIANFGQSRRFTHPQYFEAAMHAIQVNPRYDQKKQLLGYVMYAISCLNAESAYRCAEKLSYIYDVFDNDDFKKELIEIAVRAFSRSIFFKVRNKSLIFLLSKFNELEEGVRNDIEYRVMNDNLKESEIFWDNGVPFISEKYSFTLDMPEIDAVEQLNLTNKIVKGEIISDESIWRLLYSNTGLPINVIKQALNSNEGFIRGRAAIMFFKQYYAFDVAEREKAAVLIFADEYPSVIAEGIKAIFEFSLGAASKRDLIFFTNLIRQSFSSQFVVLRLRVFLMTFGIDYGSESMAWDSFSKEELSTIWLMWGDIFADFMAACQVQDINFTSGRYSETLRLATKHIAPYQGLLISSSIWSWIERTILFRELDTHELTCLDFMLATTGSIPSERLALFRKIIANADTGLTSYNLQYALYNWAELSTEEKQSVASLLQEERKDKRWLKAAIATHKGQVPNDLQAILYGDSQFMNNKVSEIVQKYSVDFLEDCLRMYCAVPEFPFWHYGLHGRGNSPWHSIVKYILANQLIGFEICISRFLSNVVNCPGKEWDGWEDVWQASCDNYHDRDYLLDALIIQTGSSSVCIEPTTTLWFIIHEAYKANDDLGQFGKVIAANIDILEGTGDTEDLLRIIDPQVWFNDICPCFLSDSIVNTLLATLASLENLNIDIDSWQHTVSILSEQLKVNPCRLYFTSIYTRHLIKIINKPQLELEKLRFHYDITARQGRTKLAEIRDNEVKRIKDWVFTTQYLSRYNS